MAVDLAAQTLRTAEIFESIQGEGVLSGRWCTFVRFQGCSVGCEWCDTKYTWDFKGGTPMTLEEIAASVRTRHVVLTGGEPGQQPPAPMLALVRTLRGAGRFIQVETSGCFFTPWLAEIDWRTVSPKPPTWEIHRDLFPLVNELKYVVDGEFTPDRVPAELPAGCQVSLQPEGNKREFIERAIEWLKERDAWRLSLQLHKVLEMP